MTETDVLTETEVAAVLVRLEAIAREAGELALGFFRPGERTAAKISYKNGGSPVTEADLAVNAFLAESLRALAPEAAWLSEETEDEPGLRLGRARLFVVDPIDGTHAFLRGDERWSVSIALVEGERPVAGVIHAPALNATFAAALGRGAFLNGAAIEASRKMALTGAQVVAPRAFVDYLAGSKFNLEIKPRTPSLALRLADVAAGRRDIAIASANARDWDIAAADLILAEAGGVLAELDGRRLSYNRETVARDVLIAAPSALFPSSLALARAAAKSST